jgi:hypothetical protein
VSASALNPESHNASFTCCAERLHFRIPLGTTLGGVPVTRGVPAALISRTGLEASASVMVLDSIASKR